MSTYLVILIFIVVQFSCLPGAEFKSQDGADSIRGLWKEQPDRLRNLFHELDLNAEELLSVKLSLEKNDTIAACEALILYFQNIKRDWVLQTIEPIPLKEALSIADDLFFNKVTIDENEEQIPRHSDGRWQWNYTGPKGDDEFAYTLNGHQYLLAILQAWQETNQDRYVVTFTRIITDWILQHPIPLEGDSIYMVLDTNQSLDWRDIGEVEWRTLETGNRLGVSWIPLFFAFQQEQSFNAVARLLMLISMVEQAAYLRKYHKLRHNWTTMEMNGLALAALAFPEFRESLNWANYALEVMTGEINRQVYPDGVQTEISTKTQWVALRRFESLADHFQRVGRPVPSEYRKRILEMYEYLAWCMRPDGHQPLNNDSDREDLRPRVLQAASRYNRPEWEFIATNGRSGVQPKSPPSVTFPWAGIHILRNDWQKEAHWTFFDNGPYGTGHQHRDQLHLSISAFGRDLLVDGGRYTHQDYFSFDPAVWRGYFRSSFSHNVILVDGKGQNAGITKVSGPLVSGTDFIHHGNFDFATGTFEDGYDGIEGLATHRRSVLYLHDRFWLVFDQVHTDRPRDIKTLWHFAPDCTIHLNDDQSMTSDTLLGNLRIVPLGSVKWIPELVIGQEEPVIQGWYSATYGVKTPSPTVVYSARINTATSFAWLIVPAQGIVPPISGKMEYDREYAIFSVAEKTKDSVLIKIALHGNSNPVSVN